MKVEKSESTKHLLVDVLHSIKWAHISTQYFGKSRSWFSQRLNGYDGNGDENDFNESETKTLKNALFDLADRIRKTAEKL